MTDLTVSLSGLDPLLKAGRVLTLRLNDTRYIATAIPREFMGGPVPEDWRAECSTAHEALGALLSKWDKTPGDFQWPEMTARRKRRA